MAFKKLVKRFDFDEDNRSRIDLTGGLRLNPSSRRLEVPRETTLVVAKAPAVQYKTDQTFTAKTWLANPGTVKQWLLFEVEHPYPPKHPDPNVSIAYVAQYRLLNDSGAFYWDGAAWSAATLDSHWNTEAEVAANIPTFPVTDQKLGVEVNMWTTHKSITPRIKAFKVLYQSDCNEWDDLIYDSLVPELQESIRGESKIGYVLKSATSTVDLSESALSKLKVQNKYDITDVVAAYNITDDPKRLINLRSSFDSGTRILTLTSSVAAGKTILVEFEYSAPAYVMASSAFRELPKSPSIVILDPAQENQSYGLKDESVFDKATGDGWKVPAPRVADVRFDLELRTNKQRDSYDLQTALRKWIDRNQEIRLRGIDESFRLEVVSELMVTSAPSNGDYQTAKLTAKIKHVVFFEHEATAEKKLSAIQFAGGNLTLSLP